jgi:carboxymethylenebutenolidase
MCHSDESRPPAPPEIGAVAGHGAVEFTATDGNRFMAYEAHPAVDSDIGVVILPDVRGLHAYYGDLTVRFAEAGFHAAAIDYFGRTAGRGDRSEAFDYMPHVQQTTPAGITADTAAAAEHLRSEAGGGVRSLFTVGFCFGGGNSWRQAADTPDLSGAIGFYGRIGPVEEVEESVSAPLLVLLAGADANIDPASFDGLLQRLAGRGLACERHVYDGAPHSFFDRSFAEHQSACSDAWSRILSFTQRHRAA